MSEIKPPSNKGNKPAYRSVPVKKTRSNVKVATPSKGAGGKPVTKYGAPKKKKLPTPVIITNILMIGIILAICGVVFAIAYNNIQYDKADAARTSRSNPTSDPTSTVISNEQSTASSTSDTQSSSEDTSSDVSSSDGETSNVVPSGEFTPDFFKDDLFIGDSIFTGLYLYNHLDRANVAAAVGYTAYGAQMNPFDEDYYAGSASAYAKDRQPKRIIIMLGSNSLSPLTDFDDFINGYRGLLNTLKRDCPDSDICVLSVPPITADSSMASYSGVTNDIIDKANGLIKSLCGDLKVRYYDLNSVLKDSSGYFNEDYAASDGMHFLGTTYPVLLSGVQSVFES